MNQLVTDTLSAIDTLSPLNIITHPDLAIKSMSFNDIVSTLLSWCVSFAGKLTLAALLYFIGRWIIKRINKTMLKILERKHTDPSLSGFLRNTVKITLNLLLLLIVITTLGVKTSSIIALLASAGVALGMALSGTLQNFAGGVMILFLKPFQVGDYIEAQGQSGTVREIGLCNTRLATADNKIIFIPNGSLSTGIMKNFSKEPLRRVDWRFSLAYGQDYEQAKAVIAGLLRSDSRILSEPEPYIAIDALADNSINLIVRVWVDRDDYWTVYHQMNESVYKAFSKSGIDIPFPQLDVHIKQ